MKQIKITIDGKQIIAEQGKTVLEIAKENNIDIPSLCHHPDLKVKASCRLCLVNINGCPNPQTACSTKAENGMQIITKSLELNKLRKINLELIFSQHKEECSDCVWQPNCKMLELAKKYKVDINKFVDRKTNYPVYNFCPSKNEPGEKNTIIQFDSSKCIDCRNCVEACHLQNVDYLEIREKGSLFQVVPSENKKCIFCGQCLMHCPAGAFESTGEFEDIEKPLKTKSKIVVFQFAPSIRTSIGEEFNMPPGTDLTGQIVTGLKTLGANYVFDVSCGADFTTFEEAAESLDRLSKNDNLPMFSSCCPSWVRFVEVYYPKLIPHFTTVRSPHVILGGLLKTYWAKQNKIKPENIFVVSIMPCVSKKYEVTKEELKVNGLMPVDLVLTTRELARLFKKYKIFLNKVKPSLPDNPFGSYSGAGVIYGSSGGVMESALRTANYLASQNPLQKNKKLNIEFKEVRGHKGLKTAQINLCGKKVKVAVANGINNAMKVINGLDKEFKDFACIEVMACPGGCIGGGGQPLPSTPQIRKKRAEGLYKIDKNMKIRAAHENPALKKAYEEYLTTKESRHSICHTKYSSKN